MGLRDPRGLSNCAVRRKGPKRLQHFSLAPPPEPPPAAVGAGGLAWYPAGGRWESFRPSEADLGGIGHRGPRGTPGPYGANSGGRTGLAALGS